MANSPQASDPAATSVEPSISQQDPTPATSTLQGGQPDAHQQQQQQQHGAHEPSPPVQAWRQGKLTLGFSGGGFLLPYHLGVYQALAVMGIINAHTPMAGASAGSLVAGGIKSGLSVQQQMDSFLQAAHACRQGGVNGRLRQVLKAQLQETMPADAAARCSDGTCWISVTQVFPRPSNKLYGAFGSRQQLIKALLASCHLPRVSDGGLFTSYKSVHKRVFDGGFSNLCPVPPVPIHSSSSSSGSNSAGDLAAGHPPANSAAAGGVGAVSAAAAAANPNSSATNASSSTPAVASRSASTTANPICRTEPHPTAPAAALLLHRIDSTKGITTKLMPAKGKGTNTGTAITTTKSSSSSSSGLVYRRSLSAPEAATHSWQHAQHNSSSFGHSSGSSSHTGHRGVRLQPGLWAGRRQQQQQQQQTEQLLVAGCEVTGPGAYVAAEGWFAIRVCVLPAKHMHEFPAMFRAPAADELAIALDKFQEWPHDLNATTNLALNPQGDDFLWDLFTRGQQDAASWAQQQGFPPEVLQRAQIAAAAGAGGGVGGLPEELGVVRGSTAVGDGNGVESTVQDEVAAGARVVAAAAQGVQEVAQVVQVQQG